MKRYLLILVSLSMLSAVISAAYREELTKPFTIQAGYQSAMDISVTPIAAQTQSYLAGMPFDIESQQVWYGYTEHGREIANWSILSNTGFDLRIKADPMYPVEDDGVTKKAGYTGEGLDYILELQYIIGYPVESGEVESVSGSISCSSADGEVVFENISSGYATGDSDDPHFIGSVDGSIFFIFDENSSDRIIAAAEDFDNADVPAGRYGAQVVFTMVGV